MRKSAAIITMILVIVIGLIMVSCPTDIEVYQVSFDSRGGSASNPAIKSVISGLQYGKLPTTTRTGYAFGGWWTGEDGTGTQIVDTTRVSTTADHTLYAKWAITYTVTFDKQSGSGGSDSVTTVLDSEMPPATAPMRLGFDFDGYYDQINGEGRQYYSAAMRSARNWNIGENATLYANWVVSQYAIYFSSQGGTFVPAIEHITHGMKISEPIPPTRSNHEFDGWYRERACRQRWDFNTDVVTSNMTLFAKWNANSYTVTFDSQGGPTPSPESKVVTFGQAYGALATIESDGLTFDGWWTGEHGAGTQVLATTKVFIASNHTLYPKWKDLKVGELGPGGGYVFYDKGSYSDGWRYLGAAPEGWSGTAADPRYIFGYYRTSANGSNLLVGTGTGIGSGKGNTEALVAAMRSAAYSHWNETNTTAQYAAKICDDYSGTVGGIVYDDWFLPSSDELNEMYENLQIKNLGGFDSSWYYWSSSEIVAGLVWTHGFHDGCRNHDGSLAALRFRPVRAF